MKLSDLKQQIEELDAKATKGPWSVHRDEKGKVYTGLYLQTDEGGPYSIAEWVGYTPGEESDFDFIALSRTALPELLRRLLVAEEALEYERRLAIKQVELLKLRMEEEPKAADSIRPFGSAAWRASERMKSALATIRGGEE